MEALGVPIELDNIAWSGFCQQGDGARFTGYVQGEGFDTFAKLHGLYELYPILETSFKAGCEPYIDIAKNGSSHHYVHQNTVSAEFRTESEFNEVADDNEFMQATALALDVSISVIWADASSHGLDYHLTEIFRGYMTELYNALETLHDELTTDEAVWEQLLADGWEVDDGEA